MDGGSDGNRLWERRASEFILLAAHSYGFMLLKNASASACFTYILRENRME
jgi:hypothetical protein